MTSPDPRPHMWISNDAFARMTGVKFVCMVCGRGVASRRDPEARESCPGKRSDR